MATSIPNLSTLRRGRGGPRLRGKRGPPVAPSEPTDLNIEDNPAARDKVVQGTDNDASSSRLSAIELGYLTDSYAQAFTGDTVTAPRRFPIINRGTYVRTTAIDLLVSRFLAANHGSRKQIISLGAGSDTRFFRMLELAGSLAYHELDFASNIVSKRTAIGKSSVLSERLKIAQAAGSRYTLHETDLRTLNADTNSLDGIEVDIPTLILSECCLCYLLPEEASAVLEHFTSKLTNSTGIVIYEPIRPSDAFGQTMVTNLASRGIRLATISRYRDLASQKDRLKQAGFDAKQGAMDVYQIWRSNSWVSQEERERVEKLEWLDELEEWELLASHYCIAWASRGDHFNAAWSSLDSGLL